MPLVSIIIPVYNTEQYVAETLNSLLNQTYKNIEIICINDGSIDNSLKILNEYSKKDNRIKVFSQENKGLPATKNIGISLSKGKYVNFVDSDDTISTNTIETSVKIAEETDCDVVVNYLNLTNNYIGKNIINRPWLSAPQPFMKKEVFKKYGIFYDEDLTTGEDVIFSHKLLALTDKVSLNPNSFYFYRVREGQMTDKKNDSRFVFYIQQWLEKFTEFYNERNLWEQNNNHIIDFFATLIIPNYSSRNLNYKERTEIFDLLHDFYKKNNLKIKLNNLLNFLVMIFLTCQSTWQYEPFRFFIRLFIKFVSMAKKCIKKRC